MRNIKYLINKMIFWVLSTINYIIPKRKQIFFYCGNKVTDNSKALFDYLISNHKYDEYKIICYTEKVSNMKYNKSNVKMIQNKLQLIFYYITSQYIFYSFYFRFKMKPGKGQQIINLWHGMPLKTIGYLAEDSKYPYKLKDTFSKVIVTGEYFENIILKSFECNKDQLLKCGYPRTDSFYSSKNIKGKLNINPKDKVIFWMPTYRNSKNLKSVNSDKPFPLLTLENIKQVNSHLKKLGIIIILKLHPHQNKINLFEDKYSNIILIDDSFLDKLKIELYELLSQVDALLTDYSSVYFDFLKVNKPIGFVIDDIQNYVEKRGFSVSNPLEIMPGEKIYNISNFIEFLKEFKEGKDNYLEERMKINQLCNSYSVENNCEKILNAVGVVPVGTIK